MKSRIRCATYFPVTIALFTCWIICAPSARAVSFFGLGFLSGSTASSASDVSLDGTTVVGRSRLASGWQAFRWSSAGGMQPLGFLTPSIPSSEALGTSADGSVVVGQVSNGRSAFDVGFRWTSASGMQSIGTLPNPGGYEYSYALSASADGSVIVGGSSSSGSGNEAFRWTLVGGIQGLGRFPGVTNATNGTATGISADGTVIVGAATANQTTARYHAFRWTLGTGLQDLGLLPGGIGSSSAWAISADGTVIVGDSSSANGQRAFRWTATEGMQALDDVPGFPNYFFLPQSVSGNGSLIVGYIGGGSATTSTALIWDAVHGTRKLQDALNSDYGLDLTGWHLGLATGVSDDGRTIVGTGIDPSGRTQAWIVTIPEPSALTLVLLGSVLLGFQQSLRRWRERYRQDICEAPLQSTV